MRRGIVLALPSFDMLAPAAQAAERAGFDRVWTTEIPGRDALIRAMHVGQMTETIEVGTGIAYAPTRHPIALASAAHELNLALDGRLTVGLGTAAANIRDGLGIEWAHAGSRLAEYIELVRGALTSAGGFSFHGGYHDVDLPMVSMATAGQRLAPPPIFASGANPAALRAAARTADGILLHPLSIELSYLDEIALPAVASAEATVPPHLVSWCIAAVDADEEVARNRVRTTLAVYIANRNFARVLERIGAGSVAAGMREATSSPGPVNWPELGRLIPDALLDTLAVCGTPGSVADRLDKLESELRQRGIVELALQLAGGGTADTYPNEISLLGRVGSDARPIA